MSLRNARAWYILLILCLTITLSACGGTPTPEAEPITPSPTATAPESPATATSLPTPSAEPQPTATATSLPTPSAEPQEPAAATSTPTPTPTAGPLPPIVSRCEGLAGQLEVQILVGPAEAVGLEPVAVGNVPFAVTTSAPPYQVKGQGPISYEATLTREWGTYAVTMDMQTAVEGECSGEPDSEQLNLVLEMTGEQLVVVDAGEFHGEYPWSGTQSRDLAFPLEEGATAQGEGWAVVLHLGSP